MTQLPDGYIKPFEENQYKKEHHVKKSTGEKNIEKQHKG